MADFIPPASSTHHTDCEPLFIHIISVLIMTMQLEHILLPTGEFVEGRVWRESTNMNLIQYHIIIVPGNPGIGTFYIPFGEKLYHHMNGQMSVRTITLGGFTKEEHFRHVKHVSHGDNSGSCGGHSHGHTHTIECPKEYTLQEECQFLQEYLRALNLQLQLGDQLSREGRITRNETKVGEIDLAQLVSPHIQPASSTLPKREHRFILMCHSIGSYIGLQAMTLTDESNGDLTRTNDRVAPFDVILPYLTGKSTPLPPVRIAHAFLLFPFIRMDLSFFHYWSIRLALAMRPILRLLLRLFRLLPISLWRLILRFSMRITADHAVRAIYDTYTNLDIANAAAALGSSEFTEVKRAHPTMKSLTTQLSKDDRHNFFDPTFLARHVKRVTMYYAGREHDIWGPLEQMKDF